MIQFRIMYKCGPVELRGTRSISTSAAVDIADKVVLFLLVLKRSGSEILHCRPLEPEGSLE
jgi:hypothetical protein